MPMWKAREIIDVAMPHVGEKYAHKARAPLSNPNWRGPWDCAELASWSAYQAYGVVFGCYGSDPRTADPYSGKWYEDADNHNTLITFEEALQTPGAIIGRRPKKEKKNQRKVGGHIAISLGEGKTIEARGQKWGVVTTDYESWRRWDFGALIPGVEYERGVVNVPPASHSEILHVTSPFIRGEAVRLVQSRLAELGIDPGRIDGIYGDNTEAAVTAFQIQSGILIDGEVGPETARELGLGWPIGTGGDGRTGTGGNGTATRTYTVVAGDSLYKIARKFEVDLDALVAANPQIQDINMIRIGDVITIPGESSAYRPPVGDLNLDPRTVEVLAKTIYGEARGEPIEGQHAVGYVVLNRVAAQTWYGSDVIDVCLKKWQFSVWNPGTPSRRMLDSIRASDPKLQPQMQVAQKVLTQSVPNPIDGATHFHADYVNPPWTHGATRVGVIGRHIFYKDVP